MNDRRLVKSFIFDKMAASQNKSRCFKNKFTLQSGLKNRNYYQES